MYYIQLLVSIIFQIYINLLKICFVNYIYCFLIICHVHHGICEFTKKLDRFCATNEDMVKCSRRYPHIHISLILCVYHNTDEYGLRLMFPFVIGNRMYFRFIIPPASTKLKGGYTGFTLPVCPSVDRIVSALYLQQYSSDPHHICTSYQTTSEGVSRVIFVSNSKYLKLWQIL